MTTGDWLGVAGVVIGVVGVVISSGSWIWAVRANNTAGRAESEAHAAKDAVASLADRFAQEAESHAEVLVYRVGSGVTVINKSRGLLSDVQLGPLESFRWDNTVEIGDLQALSAGAASVADKYPDWSAATTAFVYWVTTHHHRRVNVLPIVDADPAAIAEALGGLADTTRDSDRT